MAMVTAQLGDGSGPATVENILFELFLAGNNTPVATQSGIANTFNFNPAALAQGHYTLRVTFDAAGNPGCVQPIEAEFEVRKVGCGNFPWNGSASAEPCTTEGLLPVTISNGPGAPYTLYVSDSDNSAGILWSGIGDVLGLPNYPVYGSALLDFGGESNTEILVLETAGNFAAQLCDGLVAKGCNDWYLPSFGELEAIYQQLGPNGNNSISEGKYWSSSEQGSIYVWSIDFTNQVPYLEFKDSSIRCRCVRK
ncbi:MAG: DUF1566 domain-containing protein [Saprospirales bacterium]|nr:DUF1566 domain-containing protein [Saprospirales bacterium]